MNGQAGPGWRARSEVVVGQGAVVVAAAAVPVAAVTMAATGRSWSTRVGDGPFGTLGGWALVLVTAGVVAVAVGWPPPADTAPTARRRRALLAATVGGAAFAAALGASTARLVDALADDTTVASIRPTAAGWAAPIALVVVAAALIVVTRGRRRVVVAVVAVAALVVGAGLGWRRPPVPTGLLTDRGHRAVPGARPADVGSSALAAVGDTIYGISYGQVAGIDERGRSFPWARYDDLRPAGYVGHVSDPSRDTIGFGEPLALFAHPDGLALVTDEAVFVVRPDGRSRMLVALRHDRTAASLAALAAQKPPAAVLDDATAIRGAGRDGGLGVVVVTDRGIVQVLETGIVRPVAGGASILDDPGAGKWGHLFVQGRSDGSIVVAAPCRYWEIPPTGDRAALLGDWVGSSCADTRPVPVAVRRSDDLVIGIARDGSTVPVERFADTALASSTLVTFDGRGRLVVVDAEGALRRTEVAA